MSLPAYLEALRDEHGELEQRRGDRLTAATDGSFSEERDVLEQRPTKAQ